MNVDQLCSRWVGRREQVVFLQDLISKHTRMASGFFVFGASGTGKSSVVRDVLSSVDAVFSYSDCLYLCSMGIENLFENIVMQLTRQNEKMLWELRKDLNKGQSTPQSKLETQRVQNIKSNKAFLAQLLSAVSEDGEIENSFQDLLPADTTKSHSSETPDLPSSQASPEISYTPIRKNLSKSSASFLEASAQDEAHTRKGATSTSINKLLGEIMGMQWLASYPIYIVLDNVESLVYSHFDIVSAFFFAAEACCRHICPILISQADPSILETSLPVIPVHFPIYEADDLVSIITNLLKSDRELQVGGPENLAAFVAYVVSAMENSTRELKSLMHNITLLAPYYKDIIVSLQRPAAALACVSIQGSSSISFVDTATAAGGDKTSKADDDECERKYPSLASVQAQFVTRLRPRCQQVLKDGKEFHRKLKKPRLVAKTMTNESDTLVAKSIAVVDNAFCSQNALSSACIWLIMGSFLATHTPPQQDKRMFTATATRKLNQRNFKRPELSVAPKQISIERVVAITESIMDPSLVSHLRSHQFLLLNELCFFHFIEKSEDFSTSLKIRCLVDFDTVASLAASIRFSLESYLFG